MQKMESVTESVFIDTMKDNNFSQKGAALLFSYLFNLEIPEFFSTSFDPIALRCSFSEYNLKNLLYDFLEDPVEYLAESVVYPVQPIDSPIEAVDYLVARLPQLSLERLLDSLNGCEIVGYDAASDTYIILNT